MLFLWSEPTSSIQINLSGSFDAATCTINSILQCLFCHNAMTCTIFRVNYFTLRVRQTVVALIHFPVVLYRCSWTSCCWLIDDRPHDSICLKLIKNFAGSTSGRLECYRSSAMKVLDNTEQIFHTLEQMQYLCTYLIHLTVLSQTALQQCTQALYYVIYCLNLHKCNAVHALLAWSMSAITTHKNVYLALYWCTQ